MTIFCYHSTLIRNSSDSRPLPPRSLTGPADTTSYQILLSRRVSNVTDPIPTQTNTETSRVNTTTIFESPTHHIMTLGGPTRLVRAISGDINTTVDPDVQHLGSQPTQSRLDESMTDLHTPSIEISTPSIPETSLVQFTVGQESASESDTLVWDPFPADSFEPRDKTIDKGKGKEVNRGRTNDRTYRAANPSVRAESHPRRLDPSFELISQPIPVRPLPLERRSENLSRSSTFHEDPSDQCASLDDEILEQCPHAPFCPLAEVLNSSGSDHDKKSEEHISNPELTGIDTPSPLTGIFRSDSNSLYELKITRISEPSDSYNSKPALYSTPTWPAEAASRIMPNVSRLEYLALKSSTKQWSGSPYDINEDQNESTKASEDESGEVKAQAPSLMASLPTEIIHNIYANLSLTDFNAVRRINRKWFIASIDKALLEVMLRRGGWSDSIEKESIANSVSDEEGRMKINIEWLMSKKVARECALGPDWTGNGLEPLISPMYPGIMGMPGLSTNQENSTSAERTAFRLSTATDFTEVGVHYPTATPGTGAGGSGTIFTVSICGRFLMVANGCLIYIYELNRSRDSSPEDKAIDPGELKPVSSIICPKRVLACSMDTSSHRYAVAVLLDGRMGLVCDITAPGTGSPRGRLDSTSTVTAMGSTYAQAGPSAMGRGNNHYGTGNYRNSITINSSTSNAFERAVTEKPFVFPVIATHDSNHPVRSNGAPDFQQGAWQDMLQNDIPSSSMKSLSSSRKVSSAAVHPLLIPGFRPFPTATPTAMPLEYGPRSIYRNLCSEDDPPRSVAICPQRRCVAFGCSAGIELHWVDALTGQDLNRWFPLTAPSDFLYFLPPRRGIDSAKKLRLISSAACPAESSALADRFRSSSASTGSSTPVSRLFDFRYMPGRDAPVAPGSLRSDESDHYRAVPLSDGYHILFTNPVSGVLCLGSDAPIGGPTKLLRKMWFMGPKGQDQNRPIAYAGGSDLTSGVRIVAAYENGDGNSQSIWLFSVPSDLFKDSQADQRAVGSGRGSEGEWRNWWENKFSGNDWRNPENSFLSSYPLSSSSIWPIQIRGQKIGSCIGLVDLAIHSGPELTIWAFIRAGTALVWQIDDGSPHRSIGRRTVLRDGTIREMDEDGDTEILEALSDVDSLNVELPTPVNLAFSDPMQETFDGSASFYYLPYSNRNRWGFPDEETQITHHVETLDGDGDILMTDLPDVWVRISEYADNSFSETVERVLNSDASALYGSTRWAGRLVEHAGGRGSDLVEELTGAARMDIEIH